jgi:hypothetical protein
MASHIIEFLEIIGKLKLEKRTGWVNQKINLPESISVSIGRVALSFAGSYVQNGDNLVFNRRSFYKQG